MDLKFRRNLPLLVLFAGLVAVLMFGLGNQPIIAYSLEEIVAGESAQVSGDAQVVDAVELSGSSNDANGEIGAAAESDTVVTPEATAVPDDVTAVDSTGATQQADQG